MADTATVMEETLPITAADASSAEFAASPSANHHDDDHHHHDRHPATYSTNHCSTAYSTTTGSTRALHLLCVDVGR